jgi:hypothetical protein
MLRTRMLTLLEALGGPQSGLKPNNIMTRDFGMQANLDAAAGGGPSAAREKEWWGGRVPRRSTVKKRKLKESVSTKEARAIGDRLGVDWKKVPLDQLRMGINAELEEHDTDDPKTDVIKGKPKETAAKIALAHIREKSDYYTRIKDIEGK